MKTEKDNKKSARRTAGLSVLQLMFVIACSGALLTWVLKYFGF